MWQSFMKMKVMRSEEREDKGENGITVVDLADCV